MTTLSWYWTMLAHWARDALEDVRRVPRDAWDTATVRDTMTAVDQLAVVSLQGDDAAEALNKLAQRDVVLRDGQMVGLLRRYDIDGCNYTGALVPSSEQIKAVRGGTDF
jgi:hypothetical protein